ncbi:MAG: sigma-70 family RNA polymerase sigma factor [Planctomycetes bacterium]|nr:sigma-70 family RNA polymerase sigma factor [Planctomycetota bacterium]
MRAIETPGAPAMNASLAEPSRDREDAALLAAISERRDREAFAELYARYEQPAYNLARYLTSNDDRAAEAAQEAMLRVWTRAANFRPDGNAHGWIMRIVARESMRTARKRRAETAEEGQDMDHHAQGTRAGAAGAAKLAQDEELDALRRSLERLPEAYRRIVALYYGAGMSQREIGEELDVSQRTVSTQLEEALKRLRSMLTHAGVAAAAPLLGTETIFSALSTGHVPPAGLGEATLARLSDAPVSQISRALSRKAAAASGSSALWIAGALALAIAAAAGGLWALQESAASKPEGTTKAASAKTEALKSGNESGAVAPPLEEPGLLGRWFFEKGPPEGFEIVRGTWTWQAPKDGKPGAMHSPGRVWMLAPLTLPEKLPVRIAFRFRPADKDKEFNFSAYRTDGTKVTTRTLWSQRGMSLKPSESFTIHEYVLGRYTLGMFLDERLVYGVEYQEDSIARKLCLAFVNMELYEIEIRALAPNEVPESLLDPRAVIEALNVTPEQAAEMPLRGDD